ncbi:hypothetical protein CXG81DRAFT_18585 [Caulochytrium protostelioides]|uniref:Uncharacterized protein n=1 Tax=Caulochytrium protostelioides TaxID=1555241 RepID=A0A4P9X8Q4_9FUNG|nr:hypothetical protein CXG81DRAFT_18585 [Caulochytrium protostelioides]|eukprot:RKP01642.1 hypothetical protein CXG81DRAFT_18585 [Caulochytrium protostelioides]
MSVNVPLQHCLNLPAAAVRLSAFSNDIRRLIVESLRHRITTFAAFQDLWIRSGFDLIHAAYLLGQTPTPTASSAADDGGSSGGERLSPTAESVPELGAAGTPSAAATPTPTPATATAPSRPHQLAQSITFYNIFYGYVLEWLTPGCHDVTVAAIVFALYLLYNTQQLGDPAPTGSHVAGSHVAGFDSSAPIQIRVPAWWTLRRLAARCLEHGYEDVAYCYASLQKSRAFCLTVKPCGSTAREADEEAMQTALDRLYARWNRPESSRIDADTDPTLPPDLLQAYVEAKVQCRAQLPEHDFALSAMEPRFVREIAQLEERHYDAFQQSIPRMLIAGKRDRLRTPHHPHHAVSSEPAIAHDLQSHPTAAAVGDAAALDGAVSLDTKPLPGSRASVAPSAATPSMPSPAAAVAATAASSSARPSPSPSLRSLSHVSTGDMPDVFNMEAEADADDTSSAADESFYDAPLRDASDD